MIVKVLGVYIELYFITVRVKKMVFITIIVSLVIKLPNVKVA